jgi:hypothetical protein
MSVDLSPATRQRLEVLFPGKDRGAAEQLLVEDCGTNLPGLQDLDPVRLERVRFAALKLSKGNLIQLREAVNLAKIDWRDLLMAADFGHDVHAHEHWDPSHGD